MEDDDDEIEEEDKVEGIDEEDKGGAGVTGEGVVEDSSSTECEIKKRRQEEREI